MEASLLSTPPDGGMLYSEEFSYSLSSSFPVKTVPISAPPGGAML